MKTGALAISPRIAEIEGIRGLLSLLVLYGHLRLKFDIDTVDWFWGAMEVFFSISGFLITRLLLNGNTSKHFYNRYLVRRILRIWPLYYTVLIFSCLLDVAIAYGRGNESGLGLGVIKSIFFIQNTEYYSLNDGDSLRTGYPTTFDQSWSVALEEQFYLLIPFLIVILRKKSVMIEANYKWIACVLFMILIFALILRISGFQPITLLARIDGFALGIAVALFLNKEKSVAARDRWSKIFLTTLALGFLGIIAVIISYSYFKVGGFERNDLSRQIMAYGIIPFSFFGASLTALCALNAGSKWLSFLRVRPLQHLGTISYSTYLWHIPLLVVLGALFREGGQLDMAIWIKLPLIVFLILLLSHFSYRFIERPALSLMK